MPDKPTINRRSLAAHRQLTRSYRMGIWVNGGIVLCAVAATVAAYCLDWHFIAKFTAICGMVSGIIGVLTCVAELRHRQRIIGEIELAVDGKRSL